MTFEIEIPIDVSENIERLHYEYNARKDVIAYILANNTEVSTSIFDKYNNDMLKFYKEYEIAKGELEKNFVPEGALSWSLDFPSHILTVERK